jgi:hypothetical protein
VRGIVVRRSGKLSGKDQRSSKNSFSGGDVGEVMGRCRAGQEEPWEISRLIRSCAPCTKGALEMAMKLLNETIGLRMEGGGVNRGDSKERGKAGPN